MPNPLIGELLKETQEQARLLGKSGERECDLRGKIERLERENLELTEKVKSLQSLIYSLERNSIHG